MAVVLSVAGNIWQGVSSWQYRENDWKYRYIRAAWHGQVKLTTDLDRAFEQGNSDQIDFVKHEVERYEKEIRERSAEVVNQERTQAEKAKTQKAKNKKRNSRES